MESMAEEFVPFGYYEVTMNNGWIFPNGTAAATNAYVANSNANQNPVCFDIVLDESNELIYSSPVIPINNSLSDIILDVDLPAGDYNTTMIYRLLDDQYEETGATVSVALTIKVNQ